MEDVEIGLPIGCKRDRDVLCYRPRVHVHDGDHSTHQISNVSFVNVIDVALADCDRHQEMCSQRVVRILTELPQNGAARCVDDADGASRTNSLENVGNNRAVASSTSKPVTVGMISPRARRVAVDDLETGTPVSNLYHVVVCAHRNSQYAVLRPSSRNCNNMRGRLANSDAVKDRSTWPIDLVNPLAEPVAVVDNIERKVRPHVVRVIPHSARLNAVYFALDSESRCVEHRDCSGLEHAAPVPLVSYSLELGVDPDLAHARYPRSHLRS